MPATLDGRARLGRILVDDAARPSLLAGTEPLRDDPTRIFGPLGIAPDPWQREVLCSNARRILLLCSRQSGKSQTMAAMALVEALVHPHAEVLIISRTLRQAVELMRKVKELWRGIIGGKVHKRGGQRFKPLAPEAARMAGIIAVKGWDGAALLGDTYVVQVKDKALSMDFPNGARITALPGTPDSIVSFSSVTLIIIDEASRVPDGMYGVCTPFQAVTEAVHGRPGRMVVASTPFGKRGWFYEAWNRCEKSKAAHERGRQDACANAEAGAVAGRDSCGNQSPSQHGARRNVGLSPFTGDDSWLNHHYALGKEGKEADPPFQAFRVTAEQCPRITKEFLDDERATIGIRWWSQEYCCEFVDTIDSVFSRELVEAAVKDCGGERKLWFE